MNMTMTKIQGLQLSRSNPVLRQIAKWHNLTPKIWMPDYRMTEQDIEDAVSRMVNTDPSDLFLMTASHESQPIGFIWAYKQAPEKKSVMILSLFVLEAHRNSGVARQLKEALETWCAEENVEEIQTTVHFTNEKMLRLNESMGYKPGMVNMTKKVFNTF